MFRDLKLLGFAIPKGSSRNVGFCQGIALCDIHLCFSRCFLFNIRTVRHFNTANTLDTVESEYLRTWHISTILRIWWSPGIIYTGVPSGIRFVHTMVGWRQVSYLILVKVKMGSGEDRWVSWQNNHARVQRRQNSCVMCGEDRKWALCMHTMCVHAPHTHIWSIAKLSDQTHRHWIHPHYFRNPVFLFLKTTRIEQHHSQQNPTPYTFVELHYSNSCQQFQLTYIQSQPLALTSNYRLAYVQSSSALHLSICVPTYIHNTRAHLCMQPCKRCEWGG